MFYINVRGARVEINMPKSGRMGCLLRADGRLMRAYGRLGAGEAERQPILPDLGKFILPLELTILFFNI